MYPTRSKSGLAVTLTATLIRQATLAQDSLNASLKHDVLSHLFHCDNNFRDLVSLVHEGKLPDAIHACEVLERLLADSPPPLSQSVVLADLKVSLVYVLSEVIIDNIGIASVTSMQ